MVIITILMLAILAYMCYILYNIWDDQHKAKKEARKRQNPYRKAEYDCTENFYHD